MDRISLGFVLAALYNICIILFSKGFSNNLGDFISMIFFAWIAWRYKDRLVAGPQWE